MSVGDAPTVAVVGAGIAGLAAARALAARGRAPVVLDKGRGPGGRTSTRRAAPFAFDHGAQYFTARDPGFRELVAEWVERGVVAPWHARLVSIGPNGRVPVRGEDERYVGVPRMSSLARHLAEGLDVRCDVRVAAVQRRGGRWLLREEGGGSLGEFDELVVTAPPAQAAALLGDSTPLASRAAELELLPCWAVMLGFDSRVPVDFDGAFCEGSALSWVARDSSKPGRPDAEGWVLHATPDWTASRWEADPESVVDELAAELEQLAGARLPPRRYAAAHRWRYALPCQGPAEGCRVDGERALVLAGDAYAGGRVEGAYLSGLAAAEALCPGGAGA